MNEVYHTLSKIGACLATITITDTMSFYLYLYSISFTLVFRYGILS